MAVIGWLTGVDLGQRVGQEEDCCISRTAKKDLLKFGQMALEHS